MIPLYDIFQFSLSMKFTIHELKLDIEIDRVRSPATVYSTM